MKVAKKIFLGLAGIVLALCAFILICALNPALSKKLSVFLYGDGDKKGITQIFEKKDPSENNNPSANGETADLPIDLNELPDFSIATLPEEVGTLTGYIPVEGSEEQISSDKAKELRDGLSTGDTGAALSFDVIIYPYYGMLDDTEQEIYKQIFANACATKSTFTPVKQIGTEGVKRAFEAVLNDHPELFYMESAYSVKYELSGNVVEINLSYYTIVNDLAAAKDKFNSAANSIAAGAQSLESDYEKEKYVHNALVANVMYDDTAAMNQSAYSALVNGRTVCAGYARANQYILQKLGIPCYYCAGYSGRDHAWNIVKLDDGYYNVDVTWDDTAPPSYDYFNRTDYDLISSHIRRGMSVGLPKCAAYTYRGKESGSVTNVTVPDGSTVGGEVVHNKPLRYDEECGNNNPNISPEDAAHAAMIEALAEIGLKESDVCWTIDEYYENSKNGLIAAGSGDKHFNNVVPEALFASIEKVYANDEYKKGYADAALEKLGMNKMSIQIQGQRLGNGFYRLYHNVYTWKE